MPVEIHRGSTPEAQEFERTWEREALRSLYGFTVIPHAQSHAFSALDGGRVTGIETIAIEFSLAHITRLIVAPDRRCEGIGSALLRAGEEVANYYNCHKMIVSVPNGSAAQSFFERRGYHVEAVLRQHTFKLDMAVLRKFLL